MSSELHGIISKDSNNKLFFRLKITLSIKRVVPSIKDLNVILQLIEYEVPLFAILGSLSKRRLILLI